MPRYWIAALLAFWLESSLVFAADFTKVDKLVQPLVDSESIVGCVVGVVDGDKHQVRGYGSTHLGEGDTPNGDTIYEIGSVTKAFTGTLFADMINRGEVKVDAPLQDFMPEGVRLHLFEERSIRLVDVASQTSGLPRLPDNFAPKDATNPYAGYAADRMYEFLGKYKLTRAPGEYEYSNFGMGMLGTILAKKAGQPYEQLVVDRICKPLNMQDTRITLTDEQRQRLAPPYNRQLLPEKNWDFDALAACGALRSTTNDLLKFADASLSKDQRPVVAAIHEAWKPRYGKPGQIGVGLGWHIARDNVTRFHDGMTGGYSSAIFVFAPTRLAVVVLCNTATSHTSELAEKILQAQLGMSPEPIAVHKAIKLPADELKQYEGRYALSLLFVITITVEDGKLMAQATGQDKYQIFPESATKFFYKVVDAQIEFEKGKDGKVEKLILHQGGKDRPGLKMPPVQAAK